MDRYCEVCEQLIEGNWRHVAMPRYVYIRVPAFARANPRKKKLPEPPALWPVKLCMKCHGKWKWQRLQLASSLDLQAVRARVELGNAVRRGEIVKPTACSQCGTAAPPAKLDGHHHRGYARKYWLEVVWLCRRCHSKAGQKRR